MTIEVSCHTCSEKLDDRDLIKGFIICWKCGWKEAFESDEEDEWHSVLLNPWTLYD